jgi:putative oxidoreductase
MRVVVDNPYLTMVSRLFIAGVFIYASIYKILDPVTFAKSIWYYHMVPGELINLMALILPWLEMLSGVALLFGVFYRGAVFWVNVLLVLFIIALAYTVASGIDIECGCFKAAESATEPAWNSLLLDILFLAFSLQLLFSKSKRFMLRPS